MSGLPAWLGAKVPKPTIDYEVADSVHTAPGYRSVWDDFYTCIRPADVPYDPVFEKQIHEFDPDAILCWRKQRYILPNSNKTAVYTHNVLARHVKHPKRELQMFRVEMPHNAKHPKPNELMWIWESVNVNDPNDRYLYQGGPGGYMPWDGKIVRYLRKDFLNRPVKKYLDDHMERTRARISRQEAYAAAEAEGKQREFDEFVARELAKPGDTERGYREYMQKVWGPYQRKRPYAFLRRPN